MSVVRKAWDAGIHWRSVLTHLVVLSAFVRVAITALTANASSKVRILPTSSLFLGYMLSAVSWAFPPWAFVGHPFSFYFISFVLQRF